jgi:hypothetical protein
MITHPRRRDHTSLRRRKRAPSPDAARLGRVRAPAAVSARAVTLDSLALSWRSAFDAADAALSAADRSLEPQELRDRRRLLLAERGLTVELLEEVARVGRR